MILIGQFDSPFVRRVAIALTLYRLPYEHRPWSVFGDADKLRPLNPLTRVPTLVLDDGTVLTDSHLILAHLDHRVGPARALWPADEAARAGALRVVGLACGVADKAVSLFYEKRLHETVSELWVERCLSQITETLATLEAERALAETPWWFGAEIGHADVAVACALRFATEAHPGLIRLADLPALADFCRLAELQPVFRAIEQPFVPPA